MSRSTPRQRQQIARSLIKQENPYKLKGRKTWSWIHPHLGLPQSHLKWTTGFDFAWPQAFHYDATRPAFMPDEQLLMIGPECELLAFNGLPQPISATIWTQNLQSWLDSPLDGNADNDQFHAIPLPTVPDSVLRASSLDGQTAMLKSKPLQHNFSQEVRQNNTYMSNLMFNSDLDFTNDFNISNFTISPILESTIPTARRDNLEMLSASFLSNNTLGPRLLPVTSNLRMETSQALPINTQTAMIHFSTTNGKHTMSSFNNHINQINQKSPTNSTGLGEHHIPRPVLCEPRQNIGPSKDHDFIFSPNSDSSFNFNFDHPLHINNTPFFTEQGGDFNPFANNSALDPALLSDALANVASNQDEIPAHWYTIAQVTPTLSLGTRSSAALTQDNLMFSIAASNSTRMTTPIMETSAEQALLPLEAYTGSEWDTLFANENHSALNNEDLPFFGSQIDGPMNISSNLDDDDWLVDDELGKPWIGFPRRQGGFTEDVTSILEINKSIHD
jgi:hypothetical protein